MTNRRTSPPPTTPESKENELIALAIDQVEEQLRNKTASNQVLLHYLKLASSKDRLERKMLEKKTELVTAQTEAIKAQKRMDELYENALKAMRVYSGNPEQDDEYGM